MKKIALQFFFITLIILLLFKYNINIKNNLSNILIIFNKDILPSLFPIIFISNYIKYNVISELNNKYIRFICLLFSYVPSNAVICLNNKELLFSSITNPLFSYSILINHFSLYKTLIIIIINILFNYIFLFFCMSSNNNINTTNSKSIVDIIKITTSTIINILGVIIFFNILLTILNIFISKYLLFFLEITNGFRIISYIKNIAIRNILLIFLNSFGGIAIFFQIKSINNDANYLYLLNKLIISIIITIITYIIII